MNHARLKAREKRNKNIQNELKNPLIHTVLSIKANIPGPSKNIMEAYLLVHLFTNELLKVYQPKSKTFIKSADGPYTILSLSEKDFLSVKKQVILIEENHPLGRFIDLDVYSKNEQASLTRENLNLPPRKCFLCDEYAIICARNHTHDVGDLVIYLKETTANYLCASIQNHVDLAMMRELTLEEKFGLVTKTSTGSHQDMNYDLMIKAKTVIIPFFVEMFKLGLEITKLDQLFIKGRQIGLQAEQAMLKDTKQVNCYKGLIFSLGIILMALAFTIKNKQDFANLFDNIQIMTKNLDQEFDQDIDSYGLQAYQLYGIKGARGEAMSGYKSVQYVLNKASKEAFSDTHLRAILKDLIVRTEDTVLLKRAKTFQNYQRIKAEVNVLDVANLKAVKAFTKKAIENELSFGGAADLLVVTIFLHQVKHLYFDISL
jgi:holo-ACP synthase / triphosphoribosyl-dephospho-CoA synthase